MNHEVIDAEFELHWQAPVRLRLGTGFPEQVRGPRDGLNYLTFRWPSERGQSYSEAQQTCADALRRRAPVEEARAAFLCASRDAGMLE